MVTCWLMSLSVNTLPRRRCVLCRKEIASREKSAALPHSRLPCTTGGSPARLHGPHTHTNVMYIAHTQTRTYSLSIAAGITHTGRSWLAFLLDTIHSAEDKRGSMCPLCGEEYDTSLHLLGRCRALVGNEEKIMTTSLIAPSESGQEHWSSLLKSAKNS